MKTCYCLLFCGLLIASTWSCSRMNDLHDPYLKNGEILYTGKVDSAKVFAGEERVLLRYYTSDPKAKNLMIYWNFRADSTLLPIPAKNAEDPVDVNFENLEEGDIYFELFTFDENVENRSVSYPVEGYSYGDMFRSTLLNRNIASILRNLDDRVVVIEWYAADPRSIGCMLKYTNQEGATVERMVPPGETVTEIPDVHGEAEFIEYQTVYLPEVDAIDRFYANLRQVEILGGKIIEINDNPIDPLPDMEGEDILVN